MSLKGSTSRAIFFGQVLLAHLIGLAATALLGSINTTADFGSGVGDVVGIGWLVSVPWLAIIMFVVGRWGAWLSVHLLLFCLVGPLIVCGGTYLLMGRTLLEAVAITSAVGSLALLAISAISGAWALRTS